MPSLQKSSPFQKPICGRHWTAQTNPPPPHHQHPPTPTCSNRQGFSHIQLKPRRIHQDLFRLSLRKENTVLIGFVRIFGDFSFSPTHIFTPVHCFSCLGFWGFCFLQHLFEVFVLLAEHGERRKARSLCLHKPRALLRVATLYSQFHSGLELKKKKKKSAQQRTRYKRASSSGQNIAPVWAAQSKPCILLCGSCSPRLKIEA